MDFRPSLYFLDSAKKINVKPAYGRQAQDPGAPPPQAVELRVFLICNDLMEL
jgi:hypothetical protein